MTSTIRLATIFSLLLITVACGTETGNPEEIMLRYNARSSAVDVGLDPASETWVEAVWLRFDAVEMSPACDGGDAVETVALGFADHSGADAATQTLSLPDDTVCHFQTALRPDPNPGIEPELVAGTSVGITGMLEDGRSFSIAYDETVLIDWTLDDEPVPLNGGWLLSFDLASWLDVAAPEALPGDPVRVDADTHPDVLDAFADRLVDGIQLHVDANASGTVDDGETRIDP